MATTKGSGTQAPDWSKIGRRSRAKGAAYENHIRHKLAKAGIEVARTQLIQSTMPTKWQGAKRCDLFPVGTCEGWPVVFSCKKRKGWTVEGLLCGRGAALLDSWWHEVDSVVPVTHWPFLVVSPHGHSDDFVVYANNCPADYRSSGSPAILLPRVVSGYLRVGELGAVARSLVVALAARGYEIGQKHGG